MTASTNDIIAATWKNEQGKLIASLTRMVRDISLAEELAQDALVSALRTWPGDGVPRNPGAWLMAAAKRRAIDMFRHRAMAERKSSEIGHAADTDRPDPVAQLHDVLDDDVGDDLLRLIFTSCHPILSPEARVALTLRLLGGLSTEEIARAFLVPEPTVGQRIVRAKKTIAQAQIPFEVPRGPERLERLGAVLGVIYLIFNEGYAATAGDDLIRPQLCAEAIRLGHVLTRLMAEEPEPHALLALMQLQSSRFPARTAPDGTPILLADQDRALWDAGLIRSGLQALDRAQDLGGADHPYALQAAIAACHARAPTAPDTDWPRIAALYARLAQATPSPVVELNRAVAVSMAYGPAAALPLLDAVRSDPALANYPALYAVHGDLLARLGRPAEAREQLLRAAGLTRNARERAHLEARAAAL